MNSPTITWRLRKIGHRWWPAARDRSQPRWLAARTSVIARAAAKPPGLKPARGASKTDAVRDVAAPASRPWLAASLA